MTWEDYWNRIDLIWGWGAGGMDGLHEITNQKEIDRLNAWIGREWDGGSLETLGEEQAFMWGEMLNWTRDNIENNPSISEDNKERLYDHIEDMAEF